MKEHEEIDYLVIREEREDGSKCDKRLKTKQSKRDVPIHPELIRLGFLDFVAARRKDDGSPRLFPELSGGKTGYSVIHFRNGLRDLSKPRLAVQQKRRSTASDISSASDPPCPISVEPVARLQDGKAAIRINTGRFSSTEAAEELLRMLAEDIEKVKYPGLELSHLCTSVICNWLQSALLVTP